MSNKREVPRTGRVIGHLVRFLPRQENARGEGITIVKQEKIGAFVQIQVDGKKFFTVPSRSNEHLLDGNEAATEELRAKVYNELTTQHPFGSPRDFIEHVTTKADKGKKTTLRRYELAE